MELRQNLVEGIKIVVLRYEAVCNNEIDKKKETVVIGLVIVLMNMN